MKLLNRLLFTLLLAIALMHYSHGRKLSEGETMMPYQVAGIVLDNDAPELSHETAAETTADITKKTAVAQTGLVNGTASAIVVKGHKQSTQLVPSQKKATGSGVKITPSSNNHQLNGAPTLLMEDKDRKRYQDRSLGRTGNLLDNSIQVKQQPKKQLIEGYRINPRGRGTSYVYGEVSKNKKGQVSGYLYDKHGKPTYVYGRADEVKTGGGRSANSSEDSGGIYLQDEQQNNYQMNRQDN